jgi:hypothetical protein
MEHECKLFQCDFTNSKTNDTQRILIAATPMVIKAKATDILSGLIERGAVEPGDWKLSKHNEVFAYLSMPNGGFPIYQPLVAVATR